MWNRIINSNWGVWLKHAERVIVSLAALAALFPLWQYWSERDDRREDRAANFVSAFAMCSERYVTDGQGVYDLDITVDGVQYGPLPSPLPPRPNLDTARDLAADEVAKLCGFIFAQNQPQLITSFYNGPIAPLSNQQEDE